MQIKTAPLFVGLACALLAPVHVVVASQFARVSAQEVKVHQHPSESSEVIGQLTQGSRIPVSSGHVTDRKGTAWYKTRLLNGEYGYVHGNEIMTELQYAEARKNGLDLKS